MSDTTSKPRAFEMSIDIDAPQDAVWDALTRANELVRWFPIGAEVKPGAGGSMTWSWGDGWTAISRIDVWDPPRLLRLVDDSARPYDANGKPLADAPGNNVAAARVAVDIALETVDGRTRVTLVHSGFGHGAAWDDELEGISGGWPFELRSLRRYLTRFRGRTRYFAHAHRALAVSVDEAWSRLVNADVVAIEAASLDGGEPYRATLGTGDVFNGVVELSLPRRAFGGTVNELGDGTFRIHAYPADGRSGVTAWAATYDASCANGMRALEQRMQKLLDALAEVS